MQIPSIVLCPVCLPSAPSKLPWLKLCVNWTESPDLFSGLRVPSQFGGCFTVPPPPSNILIWGAPHIYHTSTGICLLCHVYCLCGWHSPPCITRPGNLEAILDLFSFTDHPAGAVSPPSALIEVLIPTLLEAWSLHFWSCSHPVPLLLPSSIPGRATYNKTGPSWDWKLLAASWRPRVKLHSGTHRSPPLPLPSQFLLISCFSSVCVLQPCACWSSGPLCM